MGMYTKIDAYDKAWWEAFNLRSEASRVELSDVEPTNESEMSLQEFKAHQAREYELNHHLAPHSMTFEDVLHAKDLLTRKEIGMLKNGYSRNELKAIRASEWKAYKKTLAAKTR